MPDVDDDRDAYTSAEVVYVSAGDCDPHDGAPLTLLTLALGADRVILPIAIARVDCKRLFYGILKILAARGDQLCKDFIERHSGTYFQDVSPEFEEERRGWNALRNMNTGYKLHVYRFNSSRKLWEQVCWSRTFQEGQRPEAVKLWHEWRQKYADCDIRFTVRDAQGKWHDEPAE